MNSQAPKERDYFTDRSVLLDPYQYFEEMRVRGPVCQLETHDALLVTGFDECVEVLKNHEGFSSLNSLASSAFPLPFTPRGSDIAEQLEAHRDHFIGGNSIVAYDDERHAKVRSLINRFFTPKRLKANQAFMTDYADKMVQEAVAKGGCELMNEIASPYVTMVIADLLGVPAEDRDEFREVIDSSAPAGSIDNLDQSSDQAVSALDYMADFFVGYFQERVENPQNDLMSELVASTYPDGTKPDVAELVGLATFVFAAGQDTSAKLLGNAMRYIVDEPGLQQRLREDRERVPMLVEEALRIEGSTKATHRIARRDTTIGGVKVPAGKRIFVALAAANRDPRRWGADAGEFVLERPRAREHVAFGRGIHSCAGAPLARAEVKTLLNAFLDHTADIRLSEAKHGKRGQRHFDFEPTFIIRGLEALYLELTPP
jgi:cytochrome P450